MLIMGQAMQAPNNGMECCLLGYSKRAAFVKGHGHARKAQHVHKLVLSVQTRALSDIAAR